MQFSFVYVINIQDTISRHLPSLRYSSYYVGLRLTNNANSRTKLPCRQLVLSSVNDDEHDNSHERNEMHGSFYIRRAKFLYIIFFKFQFFSK